MKVRIVQVVEVDPKAWAKEYGLDEKEVRQDVKAYFGWQAQAIVDDLGLAPREEA